MQEDYKIPLWGKLGVVNDYAIVDASDYEGLSRWRWYKGSRGYAMRQVKVKGRNSSKAVFMHRQIMMLAPGDGLEVDHRNRNKLDNRRSNLRVVDRCANERNKVGPRGATKSGVRFVHWQAGRNKWMVRIFERGKMVFWRGYFDTIEEAAAVANRIGEEMLLKSLAI